MMWLKSLSRYLTLSPSTGHEVKGEIIIKEDKYFIKKSGSDELISIEPRKNVPPLTHQPSSILSTLTTPITDRNAEQWVSYFAGDGADEELEELERLRRHSSQKTRDAAKIQKEEDEGDLRVPADILNNPHSLQEWSDKFTRTILITAQEVEIGIDNAASAELKKQFDLSGEAFWLIFKQNDEKHARDKNERVYASNWALSEALWQFGDSLALGIDKIHGGSYLHAVPVPGGETLSLWAGAAAVPIAALVWPIFLATIIAAKYYRDAIQRIVDDTGLPPSPEQIAQIRTDTLILAVKISGAVLGWEMGQYVGMWMIHYIVPAAIGANGVVNPLGHLIVAAMIGAALGLTLGLMHLIYQGFNGPPGSFGTTLIESVKLFGLGLVAGALWYGIGAVFPPANMAEAIIFPVLRAIATYFAINCINFDLAKLLGLHNQPYTFDEERAKTGEQDPYMVNAWGREACKLALNSYQAGYSIFSSSVDEDVPEEMRTLVSVAQAQEEPVFSNFEPGETGQKRELDDETLDARPEAVEDSLVIEIEKDNLVDQGQAQKTELETVHDQEDHLLMNEGDDISRTPSSLSIRS